MFKQQRKCSSSNGNVQADLQSACLCYISVLSHSNLSYSRAIINSPERVPLLVSEHVQADLQSACLNSFFALNSI